MEYIKNIGKMLKNNKKGLRIMEKKNIREEVVDNVINQFKTDKFEREMAVMTIEVNEDEKKEIARRMGKNIYCYEYYGNLYFFTLDGLVEDFGIYLFNGIIGHEMDEYYKNMSFNDYCERRNVEKIN